jgi:hypothetical protein
MALGVLGMPVAMLTMVVSRCRVLPGLVVLPVGVMVGRLQVVVRGRVMMCSRLIVMLDGWVFGLLCHGCILLQEIEERGTLRARRWQSVSHPVTERAVESVRNNLFDFWPIAHR